MYQKLAIVSLFFFLLVAPSACTFHGSAHTHPYYAGYASAPPPVEHRTVVVHHAPPPRVAYGYHGSYHRGQGYARYHERYSPPQRTHRPPRHRPPRYVHHPAPARNYHEARPTRRYQARPDVAPQNHGRQKADKRKQNKKRHDRRSHRR